MTWSAGTVTSSAWPLKRVAAITRSPSPSPSTPSPTDSTSPATSYPSTHGTFGASGYIPIRAIVSAKLIPAARTAIRISPAPTVGSGRSCTRSTSGGPTLASTTARLAPPYPGTAGLEVHRTARVKTVELEDLLEELVRHGSVGRQRQHRLAARRLRSDGRRTDVHSVGAEDRPDPADHARLILVAEHHEMIGEWHVEALAPNLHQMRKAPRTHGGSRNLDRSVPRLEPHRDQLGELLGNRVLQLGQIEPSLLGKRGGIHEVHVLLGVAGEDPHQHREAEKSRVVLRDSAAELGRDPIDRRVAQSLRQAPQALAERDEGGQGLHLLGPHRGDVHRVRHNPAGERAPHLVGGDRPRAVLRLGRRGPEVRGHHDVVAPEQRMVR